MIVRLEPPGSNAVRWRAKSHSADPFHSMNATTDTAAAGREILRQFDRVTHRCADPQSDHQRHAQRHGRPDPERRRVGHSSMCRSRTIDATVPTRRPTPRAGRLALVHVRAASAIAFGGRRPKDVAAQAALRERFFAGMSDAEARADDHQSLRTSDGSSTHFSRDWSLAHPCGGSMRGSTFRRYWS